MSSPRVEVLLDLAIPVGLYFAVHAAAGDDRAALIASGIGAALVTLHSAWRQRRLDGLPAVMAAAAAAGVLAGLFGASPRVLLVREAAVGIPMGFAFLVTCWSGAPVLTKVYRAILAGSRERDARWETQWTENAAFRQRLTRLTLWWGVIGIAGSSIQIAAAFSLPISTAVWVTNLMVPAIVVVASVISAPGVAWLREQLVEAPDAAANTSSQRTHSAAPQDRSR